MSLHASPPLWIARITGLAVVALLMAMFMEGGPNAYRRPSPCWPFDTEP